MTRAHQKGNVLFLILIAVALFAALSYVVVQSSRSGGGGPDKEKVQLELNRVHNYTVAVKTGITRMLVRGIPLEQVSFAHSGFIEDYTNADCLSPNCDMFHYQGGNTHWDTAPLTSNPDSQYIISGYTQVKGVGTDNPASAQSSDLLLIIPDVKETTCKIINQILGSAASDPIPTDTTGCFVDTGGTNFFYKGAFGTGDVLEDTGNPSAISGKFERCVKCTGPDRFFYYSVILAR